MKKLLITLFALSLSSSTLADAHGNKIAFDQRQDSAAMEITSVQLTENGGIINAEGQMGTYGRVYVTYTLTSASADGTHGWVKVQGRGAMEDGSRAAGGGSGIYSREGNIYTMHFLINMVGGTQNLDVAEFNALTRELTHDVYIVR